MDHNDELPLDRHDLDQLQNIAYWLYSFPNDDYRADALFLEDVISKVAPLVREVGRLNMVINAAESLGEPAAWLVQHPKYMPEACVEIADPRYHNHGLIESQKAQGWVITPLFSGKQGQPAVPDAHQLWAAAQLGHGEGITDGIARIEVLLAAGDNHE